MIEKPMKSLAVGEVKYIITDAEAREDIETLQTNVTNINTDITEIDGEVTDLKSAVDQCIILPELRNGSSGNAANANAVCTKYVQKINKNCDYAVLEFVGDTEKKYTYLIGYVLMANATDGMTVTEAMTDSGVTKEEHNTNASTSTFSENSYVVLPVSDFNGFDHISVQVFRKLNGTTEAIRIASYPHCIGIRYAVDSVNIKSEIGTMSNLTTTAKANLVEAINEVDGDVSIVGAKVDAVTEKVYQEESDTYSGEIAVFSSLEDEQIIDVEVGVGVNTVYHTNNNLFNLFNRTKGTLTDYSASTPRTFSEEQYYNGVNGQGANSGDTYGTLTYITDGIQTNQGSASGGGGWGTIFPVRLPAGTYTLSMDVLGECKVLFYDSNNVYSSTYSTYISSTSSEKSKTLTFTVPANTSWTVFLFGNAKNTAAIPNRTYKNIMLVEGTASETYEECEFEKKGNNITTISAYEGTNKIWTDAGSITITIGTNKIGLLSDRVDELESSTAILENNVINRNLDVLPVVHSCVGYGMNSGGVENAKETWGMFITTDIHKRETVMQNAITYFNKYPFLQVGMCLGDMAAGDYAESDGTWYTDLVNTATKPWYTILGNHDGGNSTTGSISATVSDQFTKWIYPTLTKMGMPSLTVPYYAVHNSTYGVSAIFLDCYDVPDTKSGDNFVVSRGTSAYSQDQIDWLISELNNVPDGNHLIIFQHGMTGASTKEDCIWSQAWDGIPDISSYGEILTDIVNAWINGTTLSDTYTTSVTGLSSLTVSADFTSRGTGVFAAYVVGHYHRDMVAHSTKYSGQKIIALCCTADGNWQGGQNDLPRVENTKSQDCLTVLSVNKAHRTVNLARVGSNRTVSMTERTSYAVSY